jgi:hypothetical protein
MNGRVFHANGRTDIQKHTDRYNSRSQHFVNASRNLATKQMVSNTGCNEN